MLQNKLKTGAYLSHILPSSIHPGQKRMWNSEEVCNQYERFASHEPYQSGIDKLLSLIGDLDGEDILELGCGVGSATEKMLRARSIIATDISDTTLDHSESKIKNYPHVIFRKRDAGQALLDYGSNTTLAVAVNCIHLFENLPHMLITAYQFLPENSRFAFSTTLTSDATVSEENMAYGRAVLKMRKYAATVSKSEMIKGSSHPPLRLRDEYKKLFVKAGFSIVGWEVQRVTQSLDMIRDFLLLPGVIDSFTRRNIEPELREGLADKMIGNLRAAKLDGMQREWLHAVVEKKS